MENSIPAIVARKLDSFGHMNPEYSKSKYVQKPLIEEEDLVEFNYYLKSSLWDFEMCDHLYEKTLISTYYFRQVQRCLQEEKRFVDDRFTRFKNKKLLFRLFRGSGNIV